MTFHVSFAGEGLAAGVKAGVGFVIAWYGVVDGRDGWANGRAIWSTDGHATWDTNGRAEKRVIGRCREGIVVEAGVRCRLSFSIVLVGVVLRGVRNVCRFVDLIVNAMIDLVIGLVIGLRPIIRIGQKVGPVLRVRSLHVIGEEGVAGLILVMWIHGALPVVGKVRGYGGSRVISLPTDLVHGLLEIQRHCGLLTVVVEFRIRGVILKRMAGTRGVLVKRLPERLTLKSSRVMISRAKLVCTGTAKGKDATSIASKLLAAMNGVCHYTEDQS